jgi:hypothetical protein
MLVAPAGATVAFRSLTSPASFDRASPTIVAAPAGGTRIGVPPHPMGGMRMPVDPRGADLKRFLAEDEGGPVVMLNLLRYREGGEEAYHEYVRRFRTFLPEEAQILWVGDCSTILVAPETHRWDAVLVVRYPTRRSFTDMVANPAYQEITGLRTGALDEAILQATVPWADVAST